MQILETFTESQWLRSTCSRTPNFLVLGETTVQLCKSDQTHEPNRPSLIKGVLGYSLENEFLVHLA